MQLFIGATIVADQGRFYGIVGDPRQVSGVGGLASARKKGLLASKATFDSLVSRSICFKQKETNKKN